MKFVISFFLIALTLAGFTFAGDVNFITGNKFKSLCRYSYDDYGFIVNQSINNNFWFVKTDKLPQFFELYFPEDDFILISHNSDNGITDEFVAYLEMPNLIHWYAQNVETHHPKLTSIPIGLCNFADFSILKKVQSLNYQKNTLVYANYSIYTNPEERQKCLDETGVSLSGRRDYLTFLKELSMSYFVISPNGNGVDCHRTWEALYLKTIPIVTRSINSEFYADLPIIILDSWEDFKNLELSEELYNELWGDFDPDCLTVDYFIHQ